MPGLMLLVDDTYVHQWDYAIFLTHIVPVTIVDISSVQQGRVMSWRRHRYHDDGAKDGSEVVPVTLVTVLPTMIFTRNLNACHTCVTFATELWTADYHENSLSLRMYDQTWERILTHFLPRRTEIHRTMHKSPFCSLEMILSLKCRRCSLAVVNSYDIGHKPSHKHALSFSSAKPTRLYLPSEAALSLWDPYPKF